jgi:PAS domain S-box-containing protein
VEGSKMSKKQFWSMIFSVILPPILVVTLFVVAIGMVIIPATEDALMEKKRDMIRAVVTSATSIIEKHAQMEQDGQVSRAEAQNTAIAEMRALRYGVDSKDYLWITDLTPKMIMHPYFPELEGTLLDKYADPNGKLLFIEAVKIVKENDEGYISYMWPKQDNATEPVEKVSYVRLFKPWNWIVGSGIYLDDVQAEIQAVTYRLLIISLLIGLVVILLLLFIIRRGWKNQKDRYLFETELKRSRERYQALAQASSEMMILTIDGAIVGVNKKACEMLCLKEDELISRNISDFITDAEAHSLLSKTISEDNSYPVEIELKCKFGPERVLLSMEHALVHELPAIIYVGYSLKLNESPAISYISNTNINKNGFGIIKLENNLGGKIISADNTAIELLSNCNNKIISGKSIKNVINSVDITRLLIQIQTTTQAKNVILRYMSSNSRMGYLQASASIVHDDIGLDEVILLFITDVSEPLTIQRSTEEVLAEYLVPERKVSSKSNNMFHNLDDEEMREAFIRNKIILKQSVKIGSRPDKISAASLQSINSVFQYAIDKTILEIGAPPCKYALLACGSIGRHEPTLNTDQDTAILFESTENETFCKEYFDKFGQMVTDICAKIGIPPCNAGNSVANPKWCKSEAEWKNQFTHWINASEPENLIQINIFFDFCMLAGDENLAKNLRQHIFEEVERRPAFLFNLGQDILSFRSPIDMWGHIRSDSKHGDFVNLKGTMLHIVNFARIYALKYKIHETNTTKRLQILTKMRCLPEDTGKDTIEAWEFLFEMRLRNQVLSLELNFPQENTLILEELSSFNETLLSKAMNHISNLQKRITSDLGLTGL